MRRFLTLVLFSLLLSALGGAALLVPGCKFVESTSDVLADATAGSAASDVFRGTARAAESLRDYSPSEEHYIGRAVAAEILSRYKVHPDEKLQNYVNLVGLAVLAAPETKSTFSGYHFVVLEGEEVQAVSAPGGFVFVTLGALKKAQDEDQLAAVLAHEIAHVSLRHGIESIQAATRKQSVALLASGVGRGVAEQAGSQQKELAELARVFGDAIQDITTDLLVKGYSRDSELAADQTAAVYLRSSGYARAALVNYLEILAKGGVGGKGGWFGTHPSPQERIAELSGLGPGDAPGRAARRNRFLESLRGA